MKPGLDGRLTPSPTKAMTVRAARRERSRLAAQKAVQNASTTKIHTITDQITMGTSWRGRRMLCRPSAMTSKA